MFKLLACTATWQQQKNTGRLPVRFKVKGMLSVWGAGEKTSSRRRERRVRTCSCSALAGFREAFRQSAAARASDPAISGTGKETPVFRFPIRIELPMLRQSSVFRRGSRKWTDLSLDPLPQAEPFCTVQLGAQSANPDKIYHTEPSVPEDKPIVAQSDGQHNPYNPQGRGVNRGNG